MTLLGQLSPQPWMTASATRAVIAALTTDGSPVRFVGGCVRDGLLQRPVRDVDIATPDPPDVVMSLLRRAGLKAVPTGVSHGTVTAVAEGQPFQITTLRKDIACDGRHAEVGFTDDWEEDAARRDFTFNAMSADPDGLVYDPFNGLHDLGAGIVRFVGVARERIEEDVLRILRFFRFFAYYGAPPPNPTALAACRAMAPRLSILSAERVREEMVRILLAPDPANVMLLMNGAHVLEHVLPEAVDFGRLRLVAWLEDRGVRLEGVGPDPVRRLAALTRLDAEGALALATRLRLGNRDRARLVGLASVPPEDLPSSAMDPRAVRRSLDHLGAERFRDLCLITWGGRKAVSERTNSSETRAWITLLEAARDWSPPVFPLKGGDVIRAGVAGGPRVGAVLRDLRRWWLDEDFRPGRGDLLKRLATLIPEPGGPAATP
ncbi:MAG: CCA tRNA nucleotidyltransferase [Alphaproteobacteria bacterium]|nr:CCA tRNA nucleotidyltransferase [Alphaproteobacteria bacterium]